MWLVKHNELSFTHKYVDDMLKSSFKDKFVKLTNFDWSLIFQMEVVKKSFLKTISAYSLPKNWNSLPLELKRITSLTVLKKKQRKNTELIQFFLYSKQLLLLSELGLCDSCTFSPQLQILELWQQIFWLKIGISCSSVLWPH